MSPSVESYDGHEIQIEGSMGLDPRPQGLRIDGESIAFGVLPGGLYFLHPYAYDWHEDLGELARRFIAYRTSVEGLRANPPPKPRRD